MAQRSRRSAGNGLDAWPGYVDALSTLLMVLIFVLLVFVLAQGFLSVALSGRDKALDLASRQLADLSAALSLEKGRSSELQLSVSQLNRDLAAATDARDTLTAQISALRDQGARLTAERDRLAQRIAEATMALQAGAAARERLESQLGTTRQQLTDARELATELGKTVTVGKATIEAKLAELAALAGQTRALAALRDELQEQLKTATTAATTETRAREASQAQLLDVGRQLAAAKDRVAALERRIDDLQRVAAEMNKTVTADKATIEAKVADLSRLAEQMRALTALLDQLEQQARDAAGRATTEAQQRAAAMLQLADEKRLGESARAQIALLNQQIVELKAQVAAVAKGLEIAETTVRDKDTQIENLGQKLNAALAAKVEELQQYRSEFFGKLRSLMANRSGVQVVGDRFVFQSEVLFPVGSAELSQAGIAQMTTLAVTIKEVAAAIPPDLPWVLRIDGHTDPQPVRGGQFASNWELSAARAITVVKLLITFGVPPQHLAATGFGEYQPLGAGETPEAFAKDRRIEIRLTDR